MGSVRVHRRLNLQGCLQDGQASVVLQKLAKHGDSEAVDEAPWPKETRAERLVTSLREVL